MNNKFWDEKYSGIDYFYGEQPNEFLTQQLKHIPKTAKILCLCEGEGRNAVYLAKNGFDVTAVDFSEEAKTKALRLAVRQNVKLNYHLSDLIDYDFGVKKWDAIISVFAHLPLSLRQTIYPKVISSLRKDGIFIIEAYTPNQIEYGTGGPKDIEMMCSEEILRNDLIGMNWMFIEEGEKYLSEGLGHSGQSYTIRGVAKKS